MVCAAFGEQSLEQFSGGEVADEFLVGGEEVEFWEGVDLGPAEIVEDAVGEFSVEAVDGEELEVDSAAVAIIVADVGDEGADVGLDAEFLVEFAAEGLFRRLAGFDFAAGKLPLEAHGLIGAALADEHFVCAQNQGGHHITDGAGGAAGGAVYGQGRFT